MHEGIPSRPELVPGGPYTIDPAAMNQQYGVPQEVLPMVVEDLLAATDEAGYSPDEVVFAGYAEPEGGVVDIDAAKAAENAGVPVAVNTRTGEAVRSLQTFSFGVAADLDGSADSRSNPIHFAGTTSRARIGVYEYERLNPGAVLPTGGGIDLPVTADSVRAAEIAIFHPQYRPGEGQKSVRTAGTDPDDLIAADPELYRQAWATDAGLPPAAHRSDAPPPPPGTE